MVAALDLATLVSTLNADPRVTRPAADVVELLRAELERDPANGVDSTRLTVALVGRTKAGKSQLVKALSGDWDSTGVGVGRHRTTREARVTRLEGFDLVDLPGVGALGGEEDTALAVGVAAASDAVIWLYAESLHDSEVTELQDLLRRGKPTVVAYNAKWAVDALGKRSVFVSHPELAFRDLDTHQERITQVAREAGIDQLPLVPVHARAAWYALRDDDAELRRSSRIDGLISATDAALTERAAVLRIRSTHDIPRQRLSELAVASELIERHLGGGEPSLGSTLEREANDLLRCIEQVHNDARLRVEAKISKAIRDVARWVEKHHQDDQAQLNSSWADFVRAVGVEDVLGSYVEILREEFSRADSVAKVADRLDLRLRTANQHQADPTRGWRNGLRSSLRIVQNALVAGIRSLGLDRGVAILLSKLASRAVPGVGWWMVGMDVFKSVSSGLRDELAARSISSRDWQENEVGTCTRELAWLRGLALERLDRLHKTAMTAVLDRLGDGQSGLNSTAVLRGQLLDIAQQAREYTQECDRLLVNALLAHHGTAMASEHVERVPNREIIVRLRGSGDPEQAISLLNDDMRPESVRQQSKGKRLLNRIATHRKVTT